ncbi:MAG TPA: GNAT family N-acetyltransferase [Aggregatilinea sp.]|jgi:GNAT superfamily N-acetyltransferase|uniref:GNAT family N-acetyltransferase n=1 Tax=Aggregatilinea sp. TaxID=2806333 RepID=UPI002B7490D3|nr:GNAT family N-acetyltransferase [Aggregatilinea sp.]HML21708.1 GNAT family N-acetyltransferase [Aggregatilinea sp.]
MTNSYLPAALRCVDDFYAIMFRSWPTAVTRVQGRATLSYSGDTRLTGANHLWPGTPDAVTLEAIDAAHEFFAAYQAAWSVVYTDTYMPAARDVLIACGFYRRWSSPLMVLDGLPRPLAPNRLVTPLRATTLHHLHDVARVMSDAFLTDRATNQRIARPEMLDHPAVSHYLIYDGGLPAACATVARSGDWAGIWNVGTVPRFRHKRYATTIMLALLDDLRASGCTTTMLMASPSGQPLYERLGYHIIGTTSYMGPPRRY